MARRVHSKEQLQEMVTHLEYEFYMLADTARILPHQPTGTLENAVVDSFVIHARSLVQFFFRKDKDKDKRKDRDRIDAWDYVADWKAGIADPTADAPNGLEGFWDKASDRVAHLLVGRLNTSREQTTWQVHTICQDLLAVASNFAAAARNAGWEIDVPASFGGTVMMLDVSDTTVTTSYTATTTSPAQSMKPISVWDDEDDRTGRDGSEV